jgi:hypothetical protein
MIEGTTDIFDKFLNSRFENIHTCLPGKINKFNSATRKADVKPLVKLKNKSGSIIEIPAISDVPVLLPSGSNFSLSWAVQSGDGCLILFAETGIGNFLNGAGQDVEADDQSRFSLTDAICIPGLFPFARIPDSGVSITSDTSNQLTIELQKFVLKNQIESLGTLVKDLIIQIKALQIQVTGSTGVINPASQAALELINQRFALLLGE